jgi:selenocysteine lyase/cysteine desulfurase
VLPVSLKKWGADFIAMPGHKGLLGPQGTGILLCSREIEPLIQGGTGSRSIEQIMPDFLPDAGEAGTVNVPGIAGLGAGLAYLKKVGVEHIFARERRQAKFLAKELEIMGVKVFSGDHQGGTVSFVPKTDCEEVAQMLAEHGVCVRAGLHCAPLAHESAGTLQSGTVRVSFGHDANDLQRENLLKILKKLGF